MNSENSSNYKPLIATETVKNTTPIVSRTAITKIRTPLTTRQDRSPISVPSSHKHYQRMKYYSALRTGLRHLGEAKDYLNIPLHVIEPKWLLLPHTHQSSLVTIFSICNCMVGSSLTSLPWAYAQSGLLLGVLITFALFLICFYT